MRDEVTLETAEAYTDGLSKKAIIVNKVNEKPKNNSVCEISLDVLAKKFKDGDSINIETLKLYHIIDNKYSKFVVTDGQYLNKKLFIDADGFSTNAIKMIFLVGGEARVIQRVSK